jgi:hypothetical protein
LDGGKAVTTNYSFMECRKKELAVQVSDFSVQVCLPLGDIEWWKIGIVGFGFPIFHFPICCDT